MGNAKKIGKNFFWLVLGDVASKGILFFTTIWIARKLTDVGFGKVSLAQAILAYLMLLVNIGLPTLGTREIAKAHSNARELINDVISIRLIITVVVLMISSIILYFSGIALELKWLIGITLLFLIPNSMNIEFVFQGLEKMQYASLGQFLFQAFNLVFILIFVQQVSDLYAVPIVRNVGALLVSTVLLVSYARINHQNHLFKFVVWQKNWLDYLRESSYMVAAFMVVQIYTTFDIVMLGIFDEPQVIGWYNIAYKIIVMFITFAAVLQTAFAPFFSREQTDTDRFFKGLKAFTLIIILSGTFISGILYLSGPYLIPFFFEQKYQNSIIILKYLSIALLFIFLETIFLAPLLYTGRQKYYLYSHIWGAGTNVILNIILIPTYSYIGASVATIISQLIVFGFSAYFFGKQFGLKSKIFSLVAYGLLGWIVALVFFGQIMSFSIAAACVCFFILLCAIVFFNQDMILKVVNILKA